MTEKDPTAEYGVQVQQVRPNGSIRTICTIPCRSEIEAFEVYQSFWDNVAEEHRETTKLWVVYPPARPLKSSATRK